MLRRSTIGELKRILTSFGFWLSVGLALLILFTSVVYKDLDGSIYTVFSAISQFDRAQMIENGLYVQEIFSSKVINTFSMYGMLLSALSFAGVLCEEQKYGVRRYLLFKEGKGTYVISKALTAIISSCLSFLLAAGLFFIFLLGNYPLWTEVDIGSYTYWMDVYADKMGSMKVLLLWFGEYGKTVFEMAGLCLYAVFCSFFGYLCTAFFSNVYLTICIPFFFGYMHYSITEALAGRYLEGSISEEFYNAVMCYVSPYGYIHFWKMQDSRLANIVVLLLIWIVAIGICLLRIQKATDCGSNQISLNEGQGERKRKFVKGHLSERYKSISKETVFSKIRGIVSVALAEYKRWLWNPRILLLFVLAIYARESVGKVLCEHAVKMGEELHWLEPYLALNNSVVAILIMPVFFLVLMSDFPIMEGSYLWAIYRTGKIKWIVIQILFAFLAIVTVLFGMFLSSIFSCWGSLTFHGSWSKVVTHYYLAFPNDANSPIARLIQGDIYNQLGVGESMLLSVTLTIFMLLFYCAILLCGKIYGKKYLPLGICIGLMGMGATFCLIKTKWAFLFPSAHALLFGHLHEYLRKPIVPYWISYVYLIVGCLLVVLLAIIGIKRRDICKRL